MSSTRVHPSGSKRVTLTDGVADRIKARFAPTIRDAVKAQLDDQGALDADGVRAVVADEVRRQLGAAQDRNFTLDVLLGRRVRADRTVNEKHYKTLLRQICGITGADTVEWATQQALRTIVDAEDRGLGRIAGSTYNILGKLVTTPLLAPPDGPVLEIGTLYGLFSPALLRCLRRAGLAATLTVVDPFAGLQVQGGADLATDPTRAPVDEATARWNFREFGLTEDEVRVITGFSTDDAVKQRAGDRAYSVVVVDGDHFADGVEKDLWWVETITAPGGVVVMDDYGDPAWPGVAQATAKYLADGGRLELLGTVSSSAYLRMPTT